MLRLRGCALLFSKVRDPRLPMLDERPPEDADPVGNGARPVAAVRQRRALVEPEEIGILAGFLLDRDLDVRDGLGESGG